MCKGVQRIVRIDAELLRRDEDRPRGPEADVAAAFSDDTGPDGRSGIVSCSGDHFDRLRQAQFRRDFRQQRPDAVIAFKELRHPAFLHAADFQHLVRPALVLYIQQQHAGGIGIVAGMHAREAVIDIVLRQHDFPDAGKVLRFIFLHPEELRGCKSGKGNVRRELGELFLSDLRIEPDGLLFRASVVPQDGGTDDPVPRVQGDKAVHLAAAANPGDLCSVNVRCQFPDSGKGLPDPVLRILFGPAGLREMQRIIPGDHIQDLPCTVHQKKLDR